MIRIMYIMLNDGWEWLSEYPFPTISDDFEAYSNRTRYRCSFGLLSTECWRFRCLLG